MYAGETCSKVGGYFGSRNQLQRLAEIKEQGSENTPLEHRYVQRASEWILLPWAGQWKSLGEFANQVSS